MESTLCEKHLAVNNKNIHATKSPNFAEEHPLRTARGPRERRSKSKLRRRMNVGTKSPVSLKHRRSDEDDGEAGSEDDGKEQMMWNSCAKNEWSKVGQTAKKREVQAYSKMSSGTLDAGEHDQELWVSQARTMWWIYPWTGIEVVDVQDYMQGKCWPWRETPNDRGCEAIPGEEVCLMTEKIIMISVNQTKESIV